MTTSRSFFVLLPIVILLATPPASALQFPFSRLTYGLSLAHALTTRIFNLRTARGDVAGARRVKFFSDNIERLSGVGFWRLAWDYATNYAWRRDFDHRNIFGAALDLQELANVLAELTGADSDRERVKWFSQNYKRVLRLTNSVILRFRDVFRKSGPLKEVIEKLQEEVTEGEFLRDILEVGGSDLKGLVQILKDFAPRFKVHGGNEEL